MKKNESIKVGDTVTFNDNSYSFGCDVTKWGGLWHGIIEAKKLKVIGIDFSVIRSERRGVGCDQPCDLMLKDKDGMIWFAPSFLAKTEHRTITIDGKDIRISEESFLELKRQLS